MWTLIENLNESNDVSLSTMWNDEEICFCVDAVIINGMTEEVYSLTGNDTLEAMSSALTFS